MRRLLPSIPYKIRLAMRGGNTGIDDGPILPKILSWIYNNALNLQATVPDDGSGDLESLYTGINRLVRVYNDVDGLTLAEVGEDAVISEGMLVLGPNDAHFDPVGPRVPRNRTPLWNDFVPKNIMGFTGSTLASGGNMTCGDEFICSPNREYYWKLTVNSLVSDIPGSALFFLSSSGTGGTTNRHLEPNFVIPETSERTVYYGKYTMINSLDTSTYWSVLVPQAAGATVSIDIEDVSLWELPTTANAGDLKTFINDDANGNKLTPTLTLFVNGVDEEAGTYEVMHQVPALVGREDIGTGQFRSTVKPEPHCHYSEQQTLPSTVFPQTPNSVESPWVDNADGSYSIPEGASYPGGDAQLAWFSQLEPGNFYDFEVFISEDSNIDTNLTIGFNVGSPNGIIVEETGQFKGRIYAGQNHFWILAYNSPTPFHGTISDVKFTKVPLTSAIPPLRDADGRWTNNLIFDETFLIPETGGGPTPVPGRTIGLNDVIAGGVLTRTNDNGSPAQWDMNGRIVPDGYYRLKINVTSYTSGDLRARLGPAPVPLVPFGITGTGEYEITIQAGNVTTFYILEVYNNGLGTTLAWDSISLERIDEFNKADFVLDGDRTVTTVTEQIYSEVMNPHWSSSPDYALNNVTIAPDGTLTGDAFWDANLGGPNTGMFFELNKDVGGFTFVEDYFTVSLFVKEWRKVPVVLIRPIGADDQTYAYFDFRNNIYSGGAVNFGKIVNVKDGWKRIIFTIHSPVSKSSRFLFYLTTGIGGGVSTPRNGNHGFYTWGGMGNEGSIAREYIKNPGTGSVQINAIPHDNSVVWNYKGRYNNIGGGHLTHVINEQLASNEVVPSEDLTDASYVIADGGLTIDADVEGSFDRLNITTATGRHSLSHDVPTASVPFNELITAYAYVKSDGAQFAVIGISDGTGNITISALFDIINGYFVEEYSPHVSGIYKNNEITKVGDKWRISVTGEYLGNNPEFCLLGIGDSAAPTWSFGTPTFTGVEGEDLLASRVQIAEGGPSTYIPTTVGAIQRNPTKYLSVGEAKIPVGPHQGRLRWTYSGGSPDPDNERELFFHAHTDAQNELLMYMYEVSEGTKQISIVNRAFGNVSQALKTGLYSLLVPGETYHIGYKIDGTNMIVAWEGEDGNPVAWSGERSSPGTLYIAQNNDEAYMPLGQAVCDIAINPDLDTDPNWYKDTTWSKP